MMIIPKASKLDSKQIKEIEKIVSEFDCNILEIQGHNQCVYAILGDETHALMFKRIAGLSYIRKVDAIESPYKLMDRRSALSDHQVQSRNFYSWKRFPFYYWRTLYHRS